VYPGARVLTLSGDLRRILGVERTMLNYLMHLSGVATATARAVKASGGRSGLQVYATRKTLPGLRDAEKAAVIHGGGHPHRRDLSSAVLIKTPHLAVLPVEEAVRRARSATRAGTVIEVEVRRPTEALRAARAGASALLIDNRTPAQVRAIVRTLESARLRGRVWLELSGGITAERLPRYRRTGADAASLGSLTHSAPALPFHLVLRSPRGPGRRG
jgi:nicotinate-nucleotide pyrophosphorylase (carboxylating)